MHSSTFERTHLQTVNEMIVMSTRLLDPTSALFACTARLDLGARVLMLHSSDSELARWAVEQVGPVGHVTALHRSYSALLRLGAANGLTLGESVYPVARTHGPVNTVLLDIPRGRSVARALLWTAAQTLIPGGELYLAGSNARGIRSAISDAADLFGAAPVLGTHANRRIALATRPETLALPAAWRGEQSWKPQMRALPREHGELIVVTMPGVFAWDHLDEGAALLLQHLDVEPDCDVLDIGCGYGILGMAAARQGAHVTMVDDDLLAVRCALSSVHANDLDDCCTVLPSDGISAVADRRFDLVLANPPFHKAVDVDTGVAIRLLREAANVLHRGGRLRLAANSFLPYDRAMRDIFGSVSIVADTGRYRVLESVRV